MSWVRPAVLCMVVAGAVCQRFPGGFQFGIATASFQVEGAWNTSDKTPNMWDAFTHRFPERIADGSNADVACDSYHKWREDIKMLVDLGVDFYRFSINWPRVLPTGFPNQISEDGVRFYNDIINELLKNGIEPYVTIYHWEMPIRMYEMGSWNNPLIVDWLASYARVIFRLFGDRVRHWLTINEPLMICDFPYNGYGPSVIDPEFAVYLCSRHVLLAHATIWRIYDEEFRHKQHGQVSLTNQLVWYESKRPEDEDLAELAREYYFGRYSHPIYSKEGGWPPTIEKYIADKSKKEGYPVSRLPPFTQKEIELIRGTYDFYGVNHYTSQIITSAAPGQVLRGNPLYEIPELHAVTGNREDWYVEEGSWLHVYPEGFRKILVWLKENYGNLEYRITENGYSTKQRDLEDDVRVKYCRDYMKQVLLAINEDGVNITAYTMWSLMDNFEWIDGYTTKFGIYDVDFSDPRRPRRPRKSAHFYRDVIKSRSLDVPDPVLKDEL